jgi:hypothetical protein
MVIKDELERPEGPANMEMKNTPVLAILQLILK